MKPNQFTRIFKAHRPFGWKIAFNILLIFLANAFFQANAYVVSRMTTDLANGTTLEKIISWTAAMLFCFGLTILADRIRWIWEVKNLDCQVSDYLTKGSISHMRKISIGQHRDEHSIVIHTKMAEGEAALKNFFNYLFYEIMPLVISVTISVGAMCVLYPAVGMIAVTFSVTIIIHGIWLGLKFSKPMDTFFKFRKKVVAKSGGELSRHMGSLQIAGEDEHYGNRHMLHRKTRRRMHSHLFMGLGYAFMPSQLMSAVGRVLIIGTTAYFTFTGRYEIGAIAGVLMWSNNSLGMLQQTQRLCRASVEFWTDIAQYFAVMDVETTVPQADHPIVLNQIRGNIVFENVTFTYPKGEKHSLFDVSLEIIAGQKVGIVGPSGAGKSTLLAMLSLAYLPDRGSVRVDGIDLSNIDHASYREWTGFVEQQPLILSASLRENLLFGIPEWQRNTISDRDLEEVLRKMKLDDLIPRLRKNVGEMGIKLSGGQKQRVAIARILLKKPDLLIVDEATSAVDPRTERLVHEALDSVSPGATRIFVAHRISTVQDSDMIIVMNEGKIEAIGTHEELLESCLLYRDLVSNLLLRT